METNILLYTGKSLERNAEEVLSGKKHVTFKQHETSIERALPRLRSLRVRSHYSSCLTSEGKRPPQLGGQTVKPFPRRKSAPILIRFVARVPRKRAQHDNCFSARGTTKILLLLPARRGADGINLAEKIERVIALSHMHTHTHTHIRWSFATSLQSRRA